ncbi:phosphatidylglycerol lysyltransferase domain-containing protein [Streptomyces sp. NPDC006463]|uniref:phosphatidylglycerol lysyltransferase domain-containing protein n=1 Tax=Streptomyces sp. NPDC006463 TaxID=3364746 RepID=UPI003696C4FC
MIQAAAEEVALLGAHADHPSGALALNAATTRWTGTRVPGVTAYRRCGRHVVQFGGPWAAEGDRGALLDEFIERVAGGVRGTARLTAAQVRARDVPLYESRGFTVNQIGTSYSIDLSAFTLRGKALAKVRQNVSRARREGVTVVEVDSRASDQSELDAVDAAWLRAKGRHVKELSFLIGERGGPGAAMRRTFVARRQGMTVGYVTYSPAWGSRPGWLYDLTRRSPQATVGTIELVNLTALELFRAEGAGWLHLGLTPFAGLSDRHEPACASRVLTRALRLVAEHGKAIYPARTQEAFKLKWAPQVLEPEYAAFQGAVRPAAVWNLMRLTNSI